MAPLPMEHEQEPPEEELPLYEDWQWEEYINNYQAKEEEEEAGDSVTREWCPDQGGGRCVKGGPFFSMAKNGKKWQNMANKIITNMLN